MRKWIYTLLMLVSGLTAYGQNKDGKTYTEEDIVYYSPDSTLHFGATLCHPATPGKAPVCIFVSGTGKQDRDGTMAGHKVFKQIADYLGQRGIASLRIDDRGTGQTNGSYETATTADFATDILTALSYLRSRKDINKDKIGLISHSEGTAAAAIALSKTKDVSYWISLAGMMSDGLSSLLQQNEDLVAAYDMPEYNRKRYNEIDSIMFHTVYKYAHTDSLTLADTLNRTYDRWKVKDDAYFKSLNVGGYDHFRFPIWMYTQQATSAWYRFFIRYNPADYLTDVTIPVLALNGDKDKMVACHPNIDNFKKYLVHDKHITTVILPGLNHLFLPCKTGLPTEYASIREPFSGKALQIMYEWLRNNVLGK